MIVLGVGSLAGKEAAGVAGVALTALATAIFKQFETLRFRKLSELERSRTLLIPHLSWRRIALFCLALWGSKEITVDLAVVIYASFYNYVPDFNSADAVVAFVWGNWAVFVFMGAVRLILFFLIAFLARRTFVEWPYSEFAIGALVAVILPEVLPLILTLIFGERSSVWELSRDNQYVRLIAAFWIVFPVFTLAGRDWAKLAACGATAKYQKSKFKAQPNLRTNQHIQSPFKSPNVSLQTTR